VVIVNPPADAAERVMYFHDVHHVTGYVEQFRLVKTAQGYEVRRRFDTLRFGAMIAATNEFCQQVYKEIGWAKFFHGKNREECRNDLERSGWDMAADEAENIIAEEREYEYDARNAWRY